MFCHHCGAKLETSSRFCLQCGKPVEENATSPKPIQKPAPPSPSVAQTYAEKSTPTKKPNSQKVIVIAVVAVLLLLVIACVVAFFVIEFSDFSLLGDSASSQSSDDEDEDEDEDADEDEDQDENEDEDKNDEEKDKDEEDENEEQTEPSVEETVDPIPVPTTNPYRECYNDTQYILSQSNSRYYSPSELQSLTDKELEVAYAEISARLGEAPSDPQLQEYFESLSWYDPSSSTAEMNTYEEENQFLISVCQRQRDGSVYRSSNPYMVYFGNESSYFLPSSNSTYVTGDALYRMTKTELILARNEIYARQGYIFQDDVLREYFCCKSWYRPTTLSEDFNSSVFSDHENANIKLIQVYEEIASGIRMSSDNPYYGYYYYDYEYVFHDSSTRLLTEADVLYADVNQLIIARNEIFARNGYCFTDKHLLEYFLQCSWYRPQVAPGRLDLVNLNSTEQANVNYLLECQDYLEEVQEGSGSLP